VVVTASKSSIVNNGTDSIANNNTTIVVGTGDLTVFPNPNDGTFTLQATTNEPGLYDLLVYSSLGVMVYDQKQIEIKDLYIRKIDISNLSDGVYNIVLRNNNATMQRRVIIRK
jgi:hypothetical protein